MNPEPLTEEKIRDIVFDKLKEFKQMERSWLVSMVLEDIHAHESEVEDVIDKLIEEGKIEEIRILRVIKR